MATEHGSNDLYEVILIESDDDFAVICPGIPAPCRKAPTRKKNW